MINKFIYVFLICLSVTVLAPTELVAANYSQELSESEKDKICKEITAIHKQRAAEKKENQQTGVGGGIIPDSVLSSIYQTTKNISDTVALVLVLGQALTCNAVHANKSSVEIAGLTVFSYPNIPVWLCGAIIFFVGFMLTLSITFYLVDIAFKLGFAVIMLPIGVALWPFPPTKDKLPTLISIILKSAAIFAFLAITVSYAINLIGEAGGGLADIFERINRNETETVSKDFSLFSSNFLIVLFALMYGMKLIGSTISDYTDKFFPDKAFGKASPIHGSMTQAMDFAKKKTIDPVASWAGDVAKTQAGRVTAGTGKLLTGGYNRQLRTMGHYIAHPSELTEKGIQATGKLTGAVAGRTAKFANKALLGTAGRIVLGNKASQALRSQIDEKIDAGVETINETAQTLGAAARGKIHTHNQEAIDSLQKTTLGKGAMTTAKATAQAATATVSGAKSFYNASIKGLNKANSGINRFRDRINKPINNFKAKVYASIDNSITDNPNENSLLRNGKAILRRTLKAPVAMTAGIAKAPATLLSGVAKAPVKTLKVLVQATNVKAWSNFTGEVLMATGDKMQRNKKAPAQIAAERARREEAILKRENEERLEGKYHGEM